jgi:hypothetical protein
MYTIKLLRKFCLRRNIKRGNKEAIIMTQKEANTLFERKDFDISTRVSAFFKNLGLGNSNSKTHKDLSNSNVFLANNPNRGPLGINRIISMLHDTKMDPLHPDKLQGFIRIQRRKIFHHSIRVLSVVLHNGDYH